MNYIYNVLISTEKQDDAYILWKVIYMIYLWQVKENLLMFLEGSIFFVKENVKSGNDGILFVKAKKFL